METGREFMVKIGRIEPDRNQPRKTFDEAKLQELANSLRTYGVLEPLILRESDMPGFYTIVAGERRWRAARIAGLEEVPAVVREYSKQQTMEIALIENIQREDLNPIEEARAYEQLIKEFGMQHWLLAEKLGKNRSTITNTLRLLNLTEKVQNMITDGLLDAGHARNLVSLRPDQQDQLAKQIVKEQLSVREVERIAKKMQQDKKAAGTEKKKEKNREAIYRDLELELEECVGSKVTISPKDNRSGEIRISYFDLDQFELIADLIRANKNRRL